MPLCYIAPEARGTGFGFDLAIASGLIAVDLLRVVYLSAPNSYNLVTVVHAELENMAGLRFVHYIAERLHHEVIRLRALPNPRQITLADVESDYE